ncbi:hypothetical protein AB0G60_01665 [Streptomyces angustmyceticus]|uniref:Uncharacterized protein n=1 Tax=Streptomyces angustmyceticus TaxID=285578 RepID=A0A5J4LBU4_9ACTN|nr:hypothetical protein [Streptomyces angustmyceticus]UAL65384.1 hypothetical protein K7396_01660 [Streptomyces angustmyceticus]GES28118.1 hypothetical protein San01_06050 [Streptomyces angustmyceticus]
MKSSRLRRRLAGSAAVAALVGAGILAAAPSAVAKANVLAIGQVALQSPGLQVKVTYSCDPGMNHQLVANAAKQAGHDGSVAAGTVKKDKLTCDANSHTAQVALRPAAGSSFGKGDKVKIAVFYFDEDGFSYARQEAAVVL